MVTSKRLSVLASLVLIALVVILVFISGVFKAQQNVIEIAPPPGSALPYTVDTYGNAWDGIIAFGVGGPNGVNYLVIMDTNGTLLDLRSATSGYGVVKNIAQDTFLFQGEPLVDGANAAPTYATHIWNVETNTTQDFPNVIGHHDIDYDPTNNTFLTLQDYVKQVGNNSYLIDKIVQLDPEGNVLWSWDAGNYLPLSEADPFNNTATLNGQTVIDFTHCNTLLWDYNDSIIYLNVRNTNTFYEINQTNGNIIWCCGQFGNFTQVDINGNVLPSGTSLFYHSHDLEQVAPDTFTMFNDDFDNVTNYNDSSSQMIEFTLNEQNMTANIIRSWTAPTQYYTQFLGATDLLPNGDWLGDFGSPTHQFPENQGSNFTDTGAVLIDVDSSGRIVRTITFPVGWLIYRTQLVTNLSPNILSPIPTPTLNPTATEAPTNPITVGSIPPVSASTTTLTPTTTPTQSSQTPTARPSANASAKSAITLDLSVSIVVVVIVIAAASLVYFRKRKNLKI